MKNHLILGSRLYVPRSRLKSKARKAYTYVFGGDKEGELEVKLRNWRWVQGKRWAAFHWGDLEKMKKIFGHLPMVDKRVAPELGFRLKLKKYVKRDQRWPEQLRLIKTWMENKYGLLTADTGAGKSLVGIGIVRLLDTTTLILCDRTGTRGHWVREFRQHTNITQLEKDLGRKLISEFGPGKDREIRPITVATFQMFRGKARRKFMAKRAYFGFVIVDEDQIVPAATYKRIIPLFLAKHRMGLSAKHERYDKLHAITYDIIGPPIAVGKKKSKPCKWKFIYTGITVDNMQWTKLVTWLANHKAFTSFAADQVERDVDKGRYVLVFSYRVAQCRAMVAELRKRKVKAGLIIGPTPEAQRERIKKDLMSGKIRVIVAGKVFDRSEDVPMLDCLHLLSPASSQLDQITGRVRRPRCCRRQPNCKHPRKPSHALLRFYAHKGSSLAYAVAGVARKFCVSKPEWVELGSIQDKPSAGWQKWRTHGS